MFERSNKYHEFFNCLMPKLMEEKEKTIIDSCHMVIIYSVGHKKIFTLLFVQPKHFGVVVIFSQEFFFQEFLVQHDASASHWTLPPRSASQIIFLIQGDKSAFTLLCVIFCFYKHCVRSQKCVSLIYQQLLNTSNKLIY